MTGIGKRVELRQVSKDYAAHRILHAIDLDIEPGSFVSLLGPSGCGKTTLLRLVAGLERSSAGEIRIDGNRLDATPVHRRNLGVVFQQHALFPHKSVFENVAFGLRQRRLAEAEIARRVGEALEMVRLPDLAGRRPADLSGGQQQRVAIARAIIIEPDLLLFDEPFSALDTALRDEMRLQLKRLQQRLGITTLFVTHDQGEALALSDRVVVLNGGRIVQQGTPEDIYTRPQSAFVASFFGQLNTLSGKVLRQTAGRSVIEFSCGSTATLDRALPAGALLDITLRSDGGAIAADPDGTGHGLPATVLASDYLGMLVRYVVAAAGTQIAITQPRRGSIHAVGAPVRLHVPDNAWLHFDLLEEAHGN